MDSFDSTKTITVKIRSGGVKACDFHFPSDDDWDSYFRQRVDVREIQSRGQIINRELNTESSDLALFNSICVSRDETGALPAFSHAEIAEFLSRLGRFDTQSPIDAGNGEWVVEGNVFGIFPVSFTLKEPTLQQVTDLREATFKRVDRASKTSLTTYLRPAGVLFDSLLRASAGYSCPIPLPHKFMVMFRLVRGLEELAEEEAVSG